jgi:hypothetical protein
VIDSNKPDKKLTPQDVMVMLQIGSEMVRVGAVAITNVSNVIRAVTNNEAEQNAILDRTHALLTSAIAHEKEVLSRRPEPVDSEGGTAD